MLFLSFTVFAVVCSACSAAPSREKRFDVFDPSFPYSYAYTSPFRMGGFAGAGFPFMNPFPWYPVPMPLPVPDFSQFTPWYKGPNVCEKKKVFQEPDEMKEWLSEGFDGSIDFNQESISCRGNNEKYVCMKRIQSNEGSKMEMTKYECCYGFVRSRDGKPGCVENADSDAEAPPTSTTPSSAKSYSVRVNDQYKYNFLKANSKSKIDLRYLMPTLRNMGASKMVKLVDNVGLADDFHNNNYTIFCPPNSALEEMQNNLEDETDNDIAIKFNKQNVKKKTYLHDVVTSHLSPGFLKADNLFDGKILMTENPRCKIRINVYFTPLKILTANCVPMMSGDYFARNGIIHVVEKLLPMPSKTVADIIAGDTQFSILKRMLSLAGLVQTLRNPNNSFTLFAPTDSALKTYLKEGSGNRCTVSLMKHHIVDHVICAAALPHHAQSLNLIGELLSLSRDQNNKLYVDDVQVVVRDLMATNGVVHIIDGILTTRQTKPLSQVLEESGLYEFLSLLESAKLTTEFDSLENVTFFIPTDEVLQSIPPRHLEALLKYNNESLENILRFHVVEGQAELNTPNQLMQSLLGNSTIRFQVHTKFPQMIPQVLAQCSTVLSADNKLCGGTLHVIDKLLLPPKQTIVEFLESIEGFSTLILLLRTTGLDKRLNWEESSFTLFAPPDDAFHQMGEDTIFRLLEDVNKATDLIKMHIMLGSVCCSHLNNGMTSGRSQTRTMDGTQLKLGRSIDGVLMVGGAHVVDCDIVTTNGVIHMVDAVITHDQTALMSGDFLDNVFIYV